MASFMSGSVIMKAAGSPSYSAIWMKSLKTIGFSLTPMSRISGSVSGTKPQFDDQASLKIGRMIAAPDDTIALTD